MYKKWMGVALLAGWLGQGTVALGQSLPAPAGVPQLPEPLPCGPGGMPGPPNAKCPPNLVPGPISPDAAPPGPPEDLGLPPGVKNAFPCEECPTPDHVFFHLGTQGLQRQRLGHSVTAYVDRADTSGLDSGRFAFPFSNIMPVMDPNNINPNMFFGVRATLGLLIEDAGCSVELTGFYIPENESRNEVDMPGRLNSFFFNAPLGFEGDNGLFLQADRAQATEQTALGSAELNIRGFSTIFTGCEPIVGVRYVNLQERFSLFFDDDGLVVRDIFGNPDPTRMATYSSRVHTNIIAPQIGVEYQKGLVPGVAFGLYGKAAAGYGISDMEITLTRGDGFLGTHGGRTRHNFAQIYETGVYVGLYFLERLRFRGGYMALWIADIPEAVDQFSFDLSAPHGRQDNTGTIFFHGPSIELQILF